MPNMVAFGYTDDLKHSSIARMLSWTLLRAFGRHELLIISMIILVNFYVQREDNLTVKDKMAADERITPREMSLPTMCSCLMVSNLPPGL